MRVNLPYHCLERRDFIFTEDYVYHFGLRIEECHAAVLFVANPPALIEEIFNSGVFGGKNIEHKSSMYIIAAALNGEKFSHFRKLFPTVSVLSRTYPVLNEKPRLYPLIWVKRLIRYIKKGNTISTEIKSADVAKTRLELMKTYDLID